MFSTLQSFLLDMPLLMRRVLSIRFKLNMLLHRRLQSQLVKRMVVIGTIYKCRLSIYLVQKYSWSEKKQSKLVLQKKLLSLHHLWNMFVRNEPLSGVQFSSTELFVADFVM
ncbi:uncharacterized protein LOC142637312 isoform X1 [Castanea sativa]|uniref:uncharacterized protein LOC142637312 isoform X1 n=1 Tax=Castanea sativa TaxID=21020 RepID=UPI003F64ABA3